MLLTFVVCGCQQARDSSDPELAAEQTFRFACARCHGADGKGGFAAEGATPPRNFCDSAFQAARTDEQLAHFIRNGKGGMPAFGNTFSPAQLDGLVRWIRRFNPAQKNHSPLP